MKGSVEDTARRLLHLRQQFDDTFTRPVQSDTVPAHKLLVVNAGEQRFALRLDECAGIHACPKLVPLPSPRVSLLGMVGVRGRLLVVYGLASVLRTTPGPRRPRWLLTPRADEQIALSIDGIDAYLHVPESALVPLAAPSELRDDFCREIIQQDGEARPVLSLAAVVAAIHREAAV